MDFLRESGLRDYAATEGNLGWMCMTRDTAEGVEFTLVTFWRSVDAIKRFAGEDYTKARYYPEDDGFLLSKPERVEHFELVEAILRPELSNGRLAAGHPAESRARSSG
ncbi:MAG: antibiotic biosynthesis monooxygenase [Gammaproteobacteria bacterium]